MKLVRKQQSRPSEELKEDPKLKDRDNWQRIRLAVDNEVCHPDWGCALYRLHRSGRINNDQREAGDRFAKLARDCKRLLHEPLTDVQGVTEYYGDGLAIHRETKRLGLTSELIAAAWAENLKPQSELEIKRDEKAWRLYKEAASVAGSARNILEALVLEDVWPIGERGHVAIMHALTRLAHYFNTGTNRKR